MTLSSLNTTAAHFKSLHSPGNPVVLANVYDIPSADLIGSLPAAKALATASWAVAKVAGVDDDDLDLETNIAAAAKIAPVAAKAGKPLSVDFQHGYGERLEEGVKKLVKIGVVGINLEDTRPDASGKTVRIPEGEAVERVKRALKAATEAGVPDFVVNARCDEFLHDKGDMEACIRRGKSYLAAGATTVFVFGGAHRGGLKRDEIKQLVDAFDGRLNVSLLVTRGKGLTISEIKELGVARVSVGPQMLLAGLEAVKQKAEEMLA